MLGVILGLVSVHTIVSFDNGLTEAVSLVSLTHSEELEGNLGDSTSLKRRQTTRCANFHLRSPHSSLVIVLPFFVLFLSFYRVFSDTLPYFFLLSLNVCSNCLLLIFLFLKGDKCEINSTAAEIQRNQGK